LHLLRDTLEKTLFIPIHKDFDRSRSKKLSQFTFNGQNFFFRLTPWILVVVWSRGFRPCCWSREVSGTEGFSILPK
jgi:hypothetical protein